MAEVISERGDMTLKNPLDPTSSDEDAEISSWKNGDALSENNVSLNCFCRLPIN